MTKPLKILLMLLLTVFSLFAVTFTIYFFNLDMKLTSKIEPIFLKHYDKIKRDLYL
ncbi:MAG: hypothetical protein J6S50_08415 [Oscillospiraceae bacterium]|nr:hypothetical protein [Oscillospiraceae bacterium]MBP5168546.1 hypothetical protein [Oscillospiraceae bacterium]